MAAKRAIFLVLFSASCKFFQRFYCYGIKISVWQLNLATWGLAVIVTKVSFAYMTEALIRYTLHSRLL